MVAGQLGQLLQELGQELNLTLTPDVNETCLITLPEGLSVQMEMDKSNDFFVIVIEIANVPVGKYREDIFKEALQYNVLPDNTIGSFGYSDAADSLILFQTKHTERLTGRKIKENLFNMIDLARAWKMSIEKGEHPPQDYHSVLEGKEIAKLLGGGN